MARKNPPPDLKIDYSSLYIGHKESNKLYKRIGYKAYDINDGSFQGLLTEDHKILFFVSEDTLEKYLKK